MTQKLHGRYLWIAIAIAAAFLAALIGARGAGATDATGEKGGAGTAPGRDPCRLWPRALAAAQSARHGAPRTEGVLQASNARLSGPGASDGFRPGRGIYGCTFLASAQPGRSSRSPR